ncbi:MAG: hypothetical protein K0S61_4683 [Anaerocolumna sp.]|jgi:tripartite ATP-independent transporter DctM subunit|nr:hypothetical protein [Anaerocolumna sp.]
MDAALVCGLIMLVLIVTLLVIGTPISISIGFASTVAMLAILPVGKAVLMASQKMFAGTNSFSLLAIPFFILAGIIMNNGGIARKLVNCAQLFAGRLPGSMAQTNIVANMLFGAISGSGAAAAAAIGGIMGPLEEEEGYAKSYYAAVNVASAPTGMMIPPSNTLIVYSTVAGTVSISALFMAGYIPGILWGLGNMVVAGIIATKLGYKGKTKIPFKQGLKVFLDAIPSLLLIVIVIGGILNGIFTPTEGSAIAVVYSAVLSMCYRSIKVKDIPRILLEAANMTSIIIFMIGISTIMSYVMAYTGIPTIIADALLGITSNKYLILMIMNVFLLILGTFMDPTPAILIFTPIFLPIVQSFGMSPIHFGLMMTFNLCIGAITPPVGTVLFTGCRVANTNIETVIKTLLPFFAVTIIVLLLVTYIPAISLTIPAWFGLI